MCSRDKRLRNWEEAKFNNPLLAFQDSFFYWHMCCFVVLVTALVKLLLLLKRVLPGRAGYMKERFPLERESQAFRKEVTGFWFEGCQMMLRSHRHIFILMDSTLSTVLLALLQ